MKLVTLKDILAAAIADISNYSKKDDLSTRINDGIDKLDIEPALKIIAKRGLKEWFAETGNIVKNGQSFAPLVPELESLSRGNYSSAAENKAKNASLKSTSGSKSGKIDNSAFCAVLEKMFTLAPTKGGFKEADKASLEKLLPFLRGGEIKVDGDIIKLEVHSLEEVKQLIKGKVTDSSPDELEVNEKECLMRLNAFDKVEAELARLADLAKQESEAKTKKVKAAI